MRHAHHSPLCSVNPREHPDVKECRAAFENTPEFKERQPVPATDVGEEGNCVAADREADGLPDRPRERVDPLRRQDLSRCIDNLLRGTGERLGQLDGLERLAERDFGLAHDEVGLVVETAADHPSSRRHVVRIGDDWH